MLVISLKPASPEVDSVRALWRAHSKTLGYMPDGGFLDAAEQDRLWAEISGDGRIRGYVLFRRSRQERISIVHLCVAPEYRGAGVARALVEALVERNPSCHQVILRCRRDFSAHDMWPHLGFTARAEVAGRAGTLTVWCRETKKPPLLQLLDDTSSEDLITCAIDANVFFEMDEEASDGSAESKGLLADWLTEEIALCVTEEMFNEIDRGEDAGNRARQRVRAGQFKSLPRVPAEEDSLKRGIAPLLAKDQRRSARSDIAQLAMAAAGGARVFVTLDTGVLEQAQALEDLLDVQIRTPLEVIRRFDEVRRYESYRPRRLASADLAIRTGRAEDIEAMVEVFQRGHVAPEPRLQTLRRLREFLAQPGRFEVAVVEHKGEVLAAYVVELRTDCLHVPFFAVGTRGLAATIARYLGHAIVRRSSSEGRRVVSVALPVGTRVADALASLGFSNEPQAWVKLTLRECGDPSLICEALRGIGTSDAASLARRLAHELSSLGVLSDIPLERATALEHALWPAKLRPSPIPNFVVPIRATWAFRLFDEGLARATLFGAPPHLVSFERAYYRSARGGAISAPSRLLWYVSGDHRHPGSKAIRACSYVEEVVTGNPKELFGRFRRLGVYEWEDVFELAGFSTTRSIMAFRFSRTELFQQPVPWEEVQAELRRQTGRGSPLVAPTAISEDVFLALYESGRLFPEP